VCLAAAFAVGSATAQQVSGTLGSPSATTTIGNQQLPAPDPKYGGVIRNDAPQDAVSRVEGERQGCANDHDGRDTADDPAVGRKLRHRLRHPHRVNDADYKPPFPLTVQLTKLTLQVNRPQSSPADIKKLEAAQAPALDGASR
jgi:hypothetical protein